MMSRWLRVDTLTALLCTSFLWGNSIYAEECSAGGVSYDWQLGRLDIPNVFVVHEGQNYQLQLDLLESQNLFHYQVSTLLPLANLSAQSGAIYTAEAMQLHLDLLCLDADTGGELLADVQMQLIPNTEPYQWLLRRAHNISGVPIYNWQIGAGKGAILIRNREEFERLAETGDVTGAAGVLELKFVMVDVDSDHPILFFINSVATPFHYDFVRQVLNRYQTLSYREGVAWFTSQTYFTENRRYLAGSVVAYDHYNDADSSQGKGLYTLEFWPTDPVPEKFIAQAYQTISLAMPFLPNALAYHPVGNTHELELLAFADRFAAKNIRTIETDTLFAQLDRAILNQGEAYGRLRVIHPADQSLGEEDIAIYSFIPNTLGHVGGIITEQPQTPLSHINLKARQNNTPNAYLKNAHLNPEIAELIGQWVHYVVNDSGIHIEAASEEDVLQWLKGKIPTEVTIPESDLSLNMAMPLTQLTHSDWVSVGVKAANVAELAKVLPEGMAPDGYALPFAMYDAFMQAPRCVNDISVLCSAGDSLTFYDHIAQLFESEAFNASPADREQGLAELRDLLEHAEAPLELINQIESVRLFWEPLGEPFTQKLRVRSSTNNEDLVGFNGAGLYGSFTHKPKEGKLINSIQQVWASLWTFRAFEERRLHRIDHLQTYMGVLIHPNYGDEQVNGVAISKNIYNPAWEGFYVNAQYGELSITNPEPIETDSGSFSPVPDEFLITRLAASVNGLAWETQFIRHSNVEEVYGAPVMTDNVLTEGEIISLRNNLKIIHAHFKNLYQGDDNFAMDIEFKITETEDGSRGNLAIKQARPWVD